MSWGTALKLAESLLGLTLLYLRFCLYETEEGRLQNALVELWIRVSGYSDSTRARFGRLLRESAQISTRLLDAVFGSKPISLRAISVSGLLIFASLYTTKIGFIVYEHEPTSPFGVIAIIGALLLAALAPVMFRRRWAASIPIVAFLVLIGSTFHGTPSLGLPDAFIVIATFLVLIFPPLALDYLWLIAVRLGTKWALLHVGIWRQVFVILTSATVSLGALLILPYFVGHDGPIRLAGAYPELALLIAFVAETRLFVAAVSAVQLAVLLLAFAHWIVWPVLSRIVYAAERYQLFRERKFFGIIGLALVGHASAGTRVADVMGTFWPKK